MLEKAPVFFPAKGKEQAQIRTMPCFCTSNMDTFHWAGAKLRVVRAICFSFEKETWMQENRLICKLPWFSFKSPEVKRTVIFLLIHFFSVSPNIDLNWKESLAETSYVLQTLPHVKSLTTASLGDILRVRDLGTRRSTNTQLGHWILVLNAILHSLPGQSTELLA